MTGNRAHRPSKVVSFGTALVAGFLAIGAGPKTATADGGVVRISEQQGEYRITVLSSPNPFRAGPVEISILVQDAATREPARDVDVIVGITARDRPELTYRAKALPEVAANRLFRAARFDLSESGTWHVDVEVPAKHRRKSARGPSSMLRSEIVSRAGGLSGLGSAGRRLSLLHFACSRHWLPVVRRQPCQLSSTWSIIAQADRRESGSS